MSRTSTDERKRELERFRGKFPDADTSTVVDHMSEKFPEFGRHVHRAMLRRMKKKIKPNGKKKVSAKTDVSDRHGDVVSKDAAKKPKKSRGRPRKKFPAIPKGQTAARRNFIARMATKDPEVSRTAIVEAIAKRFPEPDEAATRAMIEHVFREGGVTPPPIVSTCPEPKGCGRVAEGADEVQRLFGFRRQYKSTQSYCRSCRVEHARKRREEAR